MSDFVLDASAVLALINQEPGAQTVAQAIPDAAISAVNMAEVVSKLMLIGTPEAKVFQSLNGLALDIVPFDADQAAEAGLLAPATKRLGLSLGDRACLTLARRLQLPVMTTERVWGRLDIGVRVVVAR